MNTLKFIFILLFSLQAALADESFFDGTQELTPEEETLSEGYVHQGRADRESLEKCNAENRDKDEYKDLCTQDRYAFEGKTGQTLEAMIPAVTKVYSTVMMMGSQKIKMKPKEEGAAGEEKQDNCKYIAVVGEAANIAYTMMQNNKTQQNYEQAKPQAKQVAAFQSLAKTHKNQEKASKMQMYVWGASAACYTAYVATGAVTNIKDSKIIVKLGAAALISYFYGKKASVHKERSELLDQLASEMPGAGDCNPFTHTTCFCNELTSFSHDPGNYNKFCMPQELAARNENNDAYVCVNSAGKADASCACANSNTCIDRVLKTGAIDLNMPPTLMRDPLAALKPLAKGFGSGNLADAHGRNQAAANRVLKAYKPTKKVNLNSKQKDLAKRLNKLGLPIAVATEIAKSSSGKGAAIPASLAMGSSDGDLAKKMQLAAYKKPMKNKYQTGGSTGKSKARTNSPFGSFKKKSAGAKGGIEVENDYAKKATLAAEIIDNKDISIFRVISNRYQSSGWRQFPQAFEKKQE